MRDEQINFLLNNDFQIMKIVDDLGKMSYWLVSAFTPGKAQGMESVDFNTLVGMEITDFFEKTIQMTTPSAFLSHFRNHLEKLDGEITLKFSSNHKWFWYSK